MSSHLILAASSSNSNPLGSILPIILIIGVFYLFVIRPQRRRAMAMRETLSAIEPGRQVITTSGMRATVISVDGDGVELEIAPGVRTRWLRGAIGQLVPLPFEEDDTDLGSTSSESDGPAS